MRTSDDLLIVEPGDRELFGHIARLVEAVHTGGRWGVAVIRGERSAAASTHIHRGEPEGFFLLDGEVEVCGAESVTRVGVGTFVLVPPDTEHTLRVVSPEATWLAIWPSALDGLPEALERARAEGRDDPESMAEILRAHGWVFGRRLPDRDREEDAGTG